MENKSRKLGFIIILFTAFLIIGCSDNDDDIILPTEENKTLAIADTVRMMFKSMNGSKDGGIDGLEAAKYQELHSNSMNSLIFPFNNLVENSSITFIGNTDSVRINGYIDCGYVDFPSYRAYYGLYTNNSTFKYKFEDSAFKILREDIEQPEWVTLGYGNKEKIEVYIETKNFYAGGMPLDPNQANPNIDDRYYWEINGTTSIDVNISITPQLATALVQNDNWQDYFDEIQAEWINIPTGKYFAENFTSPQDMIHKYQGVTWSVYKMTYLPTQE